MPLVGGYTLHLYCDAPNCPYSGWREFGIYRQEYFGKTLSGCARKARDDGWRVIQKTREAYCPLHRRPRK